MFAVKFTSLCDFLNKGQGSSVLFLLFITVTMTVIGLRRMEKVVRRLQFNITP